MLTYAFIAFLNGAFISVNRSINGRLSLEVGPFKASFWNHLVGFLFLSVLGWHQGLNFESALGAPAFTYLGGFLGAFFVAINSYILPRIGSVKTAILVISGQMITGVLVDSHGGSASATLAKFIGVSMIIFGVYLSKVSSK